MGSPSRSPAACGPVRSGAGPRSAATTRSRTTTETTNWADRLLGARRLLSKADVVQQRFLGTSVTALLWRTPVLVLETTGRKSGQRRATPVAYRRLDDDSYLVVGGAGGQRTPPDWGANPRADARAEGIVDPRREDGVAEELHGQERVTAWVEARKAWPQIDSYEAAARRPVPVFRLVRRREVGG